MHSQSKLKNKNHVFPVPLHFLQVGSGILKFISAQSSYEAERFRILFWIAEERSLYPCVLAITWLFFNVQSPHPTKLSQNEWQDPPLHKPNRSYLQSSGYVLGSY